MSEKPKGRFNIKRLFNVKRLAIGAAGILILGGAIWVVLPMLGIGGKEPAPFDPNWVGSDAPAPEDIVPGVPLRARQEDENAPSRPLPVRNEPRGIAFLRAVIEPLQEQLDRFWGWRPNDIIEFTDNVNNYQLGVLEATRRTSIVLAERISRTGSSDPYVRELEQAMSLFAINPTTYMFPRPESKYQEGLDNIREYKQMLRNGTARFHNRMDNLVPLLLTYESLLGSCTENLLKRDVSFFKVDDIFFYSQGAAAMILSVMEGVGVDFRETIEGAKGIEVYDEIVFSLRQVAEMKPLIVLKGGPHSIFANHRANMAGPMSRARFQMSILHGALTGNL
jgi:hypothetical protein